MNNRCVSVYSIRSGYLVHSLENPLIYICDGLAKITGYRADSDGLTRKVTLDFSLENYLIETEENV